MWSRVSRTLLGYFLVVDLRVPAGARRVGHGDLHIRARGTVPGARTRSTAVREPSARQGEPPRGTHTLEVVRALS